MAEFRNDNLRFAMEFLIWAQSLHRFPSVKCIADRWGCSRASAYRYRHQLADALKVKEPPNQELLPSDHRAEVPFIRRQRRAA